MLRSISTEMQSNQNAVETSTMRSLSISRPNGTTPEAYVVEPQTLISFSKGIKLQDVTFESTNRHLVLKFPDGGDIVLLDFITLSHTDQSPMLQTADGQMFSGAQIAAQTAALTVPAVESVPEEEPQQLNDIEPAAGKELSLAEKFNQFFSPSPYAKDIHNDREPSNTQKETQEDSTFASHEGRTPLYNSPFYEGFNAHTGQHHLTLSEPLHPLAQSTNNVASAALNTPPQVRGLTFYIPENTAGDVALPIQQPIDPEGSKLFITVTQLPNPAYITLFLSNGEELRTGMHLSISELLSLEAEWGENAGMQADLGQLQYSVSDGFNISLAKVEFIGQETSDVQVSLQQTQPLSTETLALDVVTQGTEEQKVVTTEGDDNSVLFKLTPEWFKSTVYTAESHTPQTQQMQNEEEAASSSPSSQDEALIMNTPFKMLEHEVAAQPKLFSEDEIQKDDLSALSKQESEELNLEMVMSFEKNASEKMDSSSLTLFQSEEDNTQTTHQGENHKGFSQISSHDVLEQLGLDMGNLHS